MLFVKNVLRLFPSFLLIAICVTSAIAQQPAFTEPYGKNEKVGKYATVNGIKMNYEIYGQVWAIKLSIFQNIINVS